MSSTDCDWCDGVGCDECQIPHHNNSMDALSHADAGPLPSGSADCEWCDGAGCDECAAAAPSLTPKLTSQPLFATPSLQRTSSQMVSPDFIQSTDNVMSLTEDKVIAFLRYKIFQSAQQLYTTFDDAEALLFQFLWNPDNLTKKWLTDGGEAEARGLDGSLGLTSTIYRPLSEDPTPHAQYLNPQTTPVNNLVDLIPVTSKNAAMVKAQKAYFQRQAAAGSASNDSMNDMQDAVSFAQLMDCPICLDDEIPYYNMIQLHCGHAVCAECFQNHVVDAAVQGVNSLNLTCPAIADHAPTQQQQQQSKGNDDDDDDDTASTILRCHAVLPFQLVFNILQKHDHTEGLTRHQDLTFLQLRSPIDHRDPAILFRNEQIPTSNRVTLAGKYRRWIAENFVTNSKLGLQPCPSPHGCSLFIYYNPKGVQRPTIPVRDMSYTFTTLTNATFMCPCGTMTCKCGCAGSHYLAKCDVAAKYLQHTDPNELTKKAIASSCKSCPKCKALITKDRNCNHVSCKCGHHFCWLCKGDWNKHGQAYFCQLAASDAAVAEHTENLTSTSELQIFSFYTSYANQYNHFSKEMLDLYWEKFVAPTATAENKAVLAQIPTLTHILQQFHICCNVLHWSYSTLVYLPSPDTNAKAKILEQQQAWAIAQVSRLRQLIVKYLKDPSLLLDAQAYLELDNRRKSTISTVEKFYKAFESFNLDEMITYNIPKAEVDEAHVKASLVGKKVAEKKNDKATPAAAAAGTAAAAGGGGAAAAAPVVKPTRATNWCCSLCACLHMATTQDLIFDSFEDDADEGDVLIDITDTASIAKTCSRKKQLTKFRGVFKNAKGFVVCANCHACQQHSEPDCRLCFPIHH